MLIALNDPAIFALRAILNEHRLSFAAILSWMIWSIGTIYRRSRGEAHESRKLLLLGGCLRWSLLAILADKLFDLCLERNSVF